MWSDDFASEPIRPHLLGGVRWAKGANFGLDMLECRGFLFG
jgi:hypothetical protein